MANPVASGIAQITNEGVLLQAKSGRKVLREVILSRFGSPPESRPPNGVRGAYLHVPFCFHKCHYCDFYSIVDSQDRQDVFAKCLIAEMRAAAPWMLDPLETIFVGGGTPTLLAPGLWQKLLMARAEFMPLKAEAEFSVEANPETVSAELACVLHRGGVNRVSIGAQSFEERHLHTLERWHEPASVGRSVNILRGEGINNINLDLIFGVPGQSLDDWRADLGAALELEPSHISCYGLMFEPNTPLTARMRAGEITPVDQDLEASMYHATIDELAAAGFEHYEVSNWARKTHDGNSLRCRHNLLYWRNENWWAFGPSASGHLDGVRWKNIARLGDYLEHSPWPPITEVEIVDQATRTGEQFMLGLRLLEGIDGDEVERLLNASGRRAHDRRQAIERHSRGGLLERHEQRLRLTPKGLLLANEVFMDLI